MYVHMIYFHLNLLLLQKKSLELVIGRGSKVSRNVLILNSHDHFVISCNFVYFSVFFIIVESYYTLKRFKSIDIAFSILFCIGLFQT